MNTNITQTNLSKVLPVYVSPELQLYGTDTYYQPYPNESLPIDTTPTYGMSTINEFGQYGENAPAGVYATTPPGEVIPNIPPIVNSAIPPKTNGQLVGEMVGNVGGSFFGQLLNSALGTANNQVTNAIGVPATNAIDAVTTSWLSKNWWKVALGVVLLTGIGWATVHFMNKAKKTTPKRR